MTYSHITFTRVDIGLGGHMEPIEEISGADSSDVGKIWMGMCEDCKGTQERVLEGILRGASHSKVGMDHGFEEIASVEDFRREMKISDYVDIEDMVETIAETGAEDLLYDGPTIFFTSTSGTTGKNKLIPESARGQDAKNMVVKVRHQFMGRMFEAAVRGSDKFPAMCMSKGVDPREIGRDIMEVAHFFPMASCIANSYTKAGIEVGFASGRTVDSYASVKGMAYPPAIMGLKNNESAMYLSMLFALRYDDVFTIAGNNASRMLSRIQIAQERAEQIIHDLRTGTIDPSVDLTPEERRVLEAEMRPHPERADELQRLLDKGRDEFIPKNYWPYLLAAEFWLSGSVGVNVDRIRPLLGDITYFDVGYGASEAKFNIPMEAGVGYGPLATFGAFYEFIPVGSDEILTADQLEDGGEYEIIVTTYSGLYRYNMHDVVKVRGFTGNTPNIEFLNKSREILNISQEKVPAPALLSAVSEHLASKGAVVRQAQVWPDEADRRYQLFIELELGQMSCTSDELDAFVCGAFPMYGRNRNFGAIQGMRVFMMRAGWQSSLYKLREANGAPASQIKLEALAKVRPDDGWVIEEVL